MRTLIIYNEEDLDLEFFILEGDYSRFDGIKINYDKHPYEEEFTSMFFDEETGERKIKTTSNKELLENKEWDKVAYVLFGR